MTRINLRTHERAPVRTLYAVLGVPPASSLEEMKAAYYALAQQYHHNGDYAEGFAEITEAWGVLRNPETRRKYDAKLLLAGNQCPRCEGKGVVWALKVRGNTACPDCKGTGQGK